MWTSRRRFLQSAGAGFGSLALTDLLVADGGPAPHHPARVDSVIFLFMYGGPSHMDTFEYKPKLYPLDGKTIDVNTFGV